MNSIDGAMFKAMVTNGYRDLKSHYKHVNELNVFPVPDGDTGTNMGLTVNGGIDALKSVDSNSLQEVAEAVGRGMLLAARGNSGVILSQFFAGLADGLKGFDEATVLQFAQAMENGVKSAYAVVVKPVEGTILTVMREGVESGLSNVQFNTSFSDYFTTLVQKMKESLEKTPELLPILKEAGVIDSGGAGLVYIIEGMAQAIGGRIIEDVSFDFGAPNANAENVSLAFNADSALDYGYCTEFIMQLSNSKHGPEKFVLKDFIAFMESIGGESIVVLQKETVVKVHVHTKTPDKVIAEAQKYGEFVTFKMENMALQHNETLIEKSRYIATQVQPSRPHSKLACVAVVPSEALVQQFKDYGATIVINAGDKNNPGADDFLSAFKDACADDILVLPDNSNSVLAAKQAAKLYGEDHIHVIESKNLGEGYAAVSIMDLADLGLEDNVQRMQKAINNVTTLLFSKSIRDSSFDGVSIKNGDYVGICNDLITASKPTLLPTLQEVLSKTKALNDKEVITFFYGQNISEEDKSVLNDYISSHYPLLEIYEIDSQQAIYDLIATLE
jgi:DAK2 domain fusion protein YloV